MGTKVLPWCGNSADLNIIENAWSVAARAADYNARNAAELFANVERAWMGIDVLYIRKLYRSMPRRVAAVIANRGGTTRY